MGYVKRTALLAAALVAVLGDAGPGRAGDRRRREPRQARERPGRADAARRSRSGCPLGDGRPCRRRTPRAPRRRRGRRAVYRALRRELRRKRISAREHRRWRRTYVRSVRTLRRLGGARGDAAAVRVHVGRVARAARPARRDAHAGRVRSARAQPPLLAADALSGGRRPGELQRAARSSTSTSPGEGLQLHPLSTFKKANAMYGFCNRGEAACDEAGHRRLLDEMTSFAVSAAAASSPGSTCSTSAAAARHG